MAAAEDRALERFELPETLSPSGSLLLARAFRTYFLGAGRPTGPGTGFASTEDPPAGRAEFRWSFDPAVLRVPPADRPPGPVSVRVAFDPSQVLVDFSVPGTMDAPARRTLARVADEVHAFVSRYLRLERSASFYLSVPSAPAGAPTPSRQHDSLRRIFAGNSTNVFLLVVLLSLPAVFFLGLYAFVLMIVVQGVVLVFADRLALGSGSVRPSAGVPGVTVIGVTFSPEGERGARARARKARARLRARLVPPAGTEVPISGASSMVAALREVGVASSEGDVRVTHREVYGRVAGIARRFGLPVPKIVVTDQPLSNAAATGVSPGRATIQITAGSLEQLTDAQLDAVIGHEFGHLRGRDPVVLFGVNAVLYLGAVFLWLPVFLYLGLFYVLLAFAVLYAVGKVLETRADTLSALVLDRPADLATALEVSAFEEEYLEERSYAARVFGWLSLDSHPPLYFRVRRLFRIERGAEQVRHAFLASARDCATGFLGALAGGK
jgi:heat shock protein HtpX